MNGNAWKRYKNDFNNLTDEEIERETRQMLDQLDEIESWVEAVESWKFAGKPRSIK